MTDRRPSLPVAKPHPLEASAAAASRAATAPHTSTPPTTDERAITDQLNVRIRRDTNQVVIDCPPSVGRLLSAGMTAATHALLVTDAAADGLRGVANVLDTIHVVQKHINPELTVAGIVINRYRKTGEQDYRETELRDRYGDLVLPGRITERIALAEAHAAQHSIHDQHTDGGRILAALFDDLYAEVSHRIHPNTAPAGAHA